MANLSDVIYKMIDNAHPVGSYYLTETDTNPSAILHVGTWVQLKDRMLIGCGDSFAISSEGGEITHTLTNAEVPAHTHTRGTMNITGNFNPFAEGSTTTNGAFYVIGSTQNGWGTTAGLDADNCLVGFDASRNWTGETSSFGGSQAHNIMNPYHTCYIWRRES